MVQQTNTHAKTTDKHTSTFYYCIDMIGNDRRLQILNCIYIYLCESMAQNFSLYLRLLFLILPFFSGKIFPSGQKVYFLALDGEM